MELNNLIRIRVDIPNTLDHFWRIDVKKSDASPPDAVRAELRQILGRIEYKGRRVYEQKGQRLSSTVRVPVWNRRATGGTIIYEVNRDHPQLRQLVEGTPTENQGMLENMVSLVESSFPKELFFNDLANKPEQVLSPEFDGKRLENMLDSFIAYWLRDGVSKSELRGLLLGTEPFASNKDFTEALLAQRGY